MRSDAERFLALFVGSDEAHGIYNPQTAHKNPKSGKTEIKGSAATLVGPATKELWQAHLRGEISLGIIPIRSDGTSYWGCIDVDDYTVNLAALVAKIERLKLPLVVCRSKSGGGHVFLFLAEPQPARAVQEVLRNLADELGLSGCEIFPKQAGV